LIIIIFLVIMAYKRKDIDTPETESTSKRQKHSQNQIQIDDILLQDTVLQTPIQDEDGKVLGMAEYTDIMNDTMSKEALLLEILPIRDIWSIIWPYIPKFIHPLFIQKFGPMIIPRQVSCLQFFQYLALSLEYEYLEPGLYYWKSDPDLPSSVLFLTRTVIGMSSCECYWICMQKAKFIPRESPAIIPLSLLYEQKYYNIALELELLEEKDEKPNFRDLIADKRRIEFVKELKKYVIVTDFPSILYPFKCLQEIIGSCGKYIYLDHDTFAYDDGDSPHLEDYYDCIEVESTPSLCFIIRQG